MPKSDKETVRRRVRDVVNLLVLGADFTAICKFGSAQGWGVGERQVRYYIHRAHRDMAKNSEQDRKQTRGRIIAQLRMLYARSLKGNDVRAALQIVCKEALFQGLYPSKSGVLTKTGVRDDAVGKSASLKRMERLALLLAAQIRGNLGEVQLLDDGMPRRVYRVPDTMVPLWFLHILSMIYVMEQLEQVATVLYALGRAAPEADMDGSGRLLVLVSSYGFSIARDGWNQFAQSLRIDGDYLVRSNYQGAMLKLCQDAICKLAPSADTLESEMKKAGYTAAPLLSAKDLARSWRRLLANIASD